MMFAGDTLSYIMLLGSWIIAVFAGIFLFYTNSFLVKQRKKEFAIYHILGMEKRHLFRMLGWENIYVTVLSLVLGLVIGIAMDKAMFLIIGKVASAEVPLGFFISTRAIRATILLFVVIFLLIFLNGVRRIRVEDPIEMLRSGHEGEREPRTRWFFAVAGLLCLGYGYYLAIRTENPVASLQVFFVAVLFVIVGTYLLFIAGSIAFLKIIRKNKRFYYQTKHFANVSGMIYRMKQNAVGLANICVLSTMVLVMVSSTTSFMVGMENIMQTRYPMDFTIYSSEASPDQRKASFEAVRNLQKEYHLNVTGEKQYTYLSFSAIRNGDTFYVGREASMAVVDSVNGLFFITLADYNAYTKEQKQLNDGEILLYTNRGQYDGSNLKVFDREYTIKEKLDHCVGNGILSANVLPTQFIVIPNEKELLELERKQKEKLTDIASDIRQFYGFNVDESDEAQNAFYEKMVEKFTEYEYEGTLESRAAERTSFIGIYGGLFFIGVFLGFLFIMATVLIIYYKQISEGYEDKERFEIMQKVGMSQEEVKGSIRSQVLMVFFLPLGVAGLHTSVAFPLISRLLALFNMTNTRLFMLNTLLCFLIFAIMYVLIY